MSWQAKTSVKRDEIPLVAVTASGEGEIPAGEVYFAGTDWRSGDLICVRAEEDGTVFVERRSRFGGVVMHERITLQRAGSLGRWFDSGEDEGGPTRWTGFGWVFEIEGGGRAVLRRAVEANL